MKLEEIFSLSIDVTVTCLYNGKTNCFGVGYLFIYLFLGVCNSLWWSNLSTARVCIQVLQRLRVSRLQTVHGVSFFLFRLSDVGGELCFSPPKAEFLSAEMGGMPRDRGGRYPGLWCMLSLQVQGAEPGTVGRALLRIGFVLLFLQRKHLIDSL